MDTSLSDGEFKHIPFRFYSSDDAPFIQRLVKPFMDDGKPKTLLNLIKEVYPNNCDKGSLYLQKSLVVDIVYIILV